MAAKKTKKTVSNKQPTKKNTPRKIAKPNYKSLRLHKRIKADAAPLPKARNILLSALVHLKQNKRLFVGLLCVQLVLTLFFVTGLSVFNSELGETKELVDELLGSDSAIFTAATLLGVLVTSNSTGGSETASLYGFILILVNGLAIIWALRKTHAKVKPKIKEPYYKGMYPVIPFTLVLCVILLQLVPLAIGNTLYSIVLSTGIAVTGLEQIIWLLLFIMLALLSLYMVTSSLFALYIVTLPDVTPLQALRSARQLVLHRRAVVARKMLFLPVVLLLIIVATLLPVIIFATSVAELTFFVIGNACIVLSHAYYYELYRKLL